MRPAHDVEHLLRCYVFLCQEGLQLFLELLCVVLKDLVTLYWLLLVIRELVSVFLLEVGDESREFA